MVETLNRVEVSPLKIAKRCEVNLSKSLRFAFNAMNAVKKTFKRRKKNFTAQAVKENFSPLPAECGEKKFTATCRMRWKKFLPLQYQILQIFTALISTLILYSQEIPLVVSDRWRSGLRSWCPAGGRGSNPCTTFSFL